MGSILMMLSNGLAYINVQIYLTFISERLSSKDAIQYFTSIHKYSYKFKLNGYSSEYKPITLWIVNPNERGGTMNGGASKLIWKWYTKETVIIHIQTTNNCCSPCRAIHCCDINRKEFVYKEPLNNIWYPNYAITIRELTIRYHYIRSNWNFDLFFNL